MKKWKKKLDIIVNGVDTPLGRAFDVALIAAIILSSFLIIIDSVSTINQTYHSIISALQFIFLVIFTLEFILRLLIAPRKGGYMFSFYGMVDFWAIFPIYLSAFISFGRFFPIIRILRLLRLFSVLKMGRYIQESGALLRALRASRAKITVFITTLVFIIIIVGALMYTIEGPANGFVSIPESMYWAVVTISTVGYGDISPQTALGKFIASGLMIIGYGIIAVPTGIITSELTHDHYQRKNQFSILCNKCGNTKHEKNAQYCHQCGETLSRTSC